MAGLQVGGLASGMDTESIITQLMSIEQAPRNRAARQGVTIQARQDALRQIDTKLTNLKLAAGDLRSAALWSPKQTVTSGTEGVLTARQVTGAAPGGYTVSVSSLASADSRTYAWNAGGGSLSVDYKSGDAGVTTTKTFDLTGKSLDDAVSTVNSDATSPVWAVNVGGKLSLLAPRDRRSRHLGLRRLRAGRGRSHGLARRLQRRVHHRGRRHHLFVAHERRHRWTARRRADLQVDRHVDRHRLGAGGQPRRRVRQAQGVRHGLQRHRRPRAQQADREARRQSAERRRRPDGRALRRRCALRHADEHAPGDLHGRAGQPGREGGGHRQRHLAGRSGRQAHLRSGGLRRRVGRGPDRRAGQARVSRRLGLRAGLRGPAGRRSRAPATD